MIRHVAILLPVSLILLTSAADVRAQGAPVPTRDASATPAPSRDATAPAPARDPAPAPDTTRAPAPVDEGTPAAAPPPAPGYRSTPVRFPPSDLVLRVDMGPGYYVNVHDHVRAAFQTDLTVGLRLMVGVREGRPRYRVSVDPELGYAYESNPEQPTHAGRAGVALMFHLYRGWLSVGPAVSFLVGYGDGELALGGRVEARALLLQRIMLLQVGYEVLHAGATHHQLRLLVGIDLWAAVRLGLNLMKPRPWALLP